MSEIQTAEIQTAEIGTEGSTEFRQFRFQSFGLLELHLNCMKSELATSTILQLLNAISTELSEIQTSSDFRPSLYIYLFFLSLDLVQDCSLQISWLSSSEEWD